MMRWVILLVLVLAIHAVDEGDWVDPYDLPIGFAVKSFYAGHLDILGGKQLYYVYTPSMKNPSKDPVVFVLSPGPGCSALYGWLYGYGEFTFTRDSDSFRVNPYPLNKEANVIYLEAPAGVGYTIGVEEKIGDEVTQWEYYRAILRFYEKFPELKDQELYLAGNHYAGIIAPKLLRNIYEHNQDPTKAAWTKLKNIKGMILFNPCTMHDECESHFPFNSYTVDYLHKHFFISDEDKQEFDEECYIRSPSCIHIEEKIEADFRSSGADTRNIFKECLHQVGPYGCLDHKGIDAFMNKPEVKTDMHAESEHKWEVCNFTLMEQYERDKQGSLHDYEALLKEERGLRIVSLC